MPEKKHRKSILTFLNQPFPAVNRGLSNWPVVAGISLLVFFILVVFQPFGLNNVEGSGKYLFIGGYGLVTFVVLSLFIFLLPALFPSCFQESKWKVWKHTVWIMLMLLTIGTGNLLYTAVFIPGFRMGIYSWLVFELFTFAIGIIPVSFTIVLSYNRLLKQNLKAAEKLNDNLRDTSGNKSPNEHEKQFLIQGQNKNENIRIYSSQLRYVKAEGNYVQVCYAENGKVKKEMIRNTLKGIYNQISKKDLILKCHRAYLVNKNAIIHAEGNAQGLRLSLKDCPDIVPVSRSYVSKVRERN